jgi:dolichol kinase
LNTVSQQLTPSGELKRKTIHLATAILPLFYYFCLTREQIIIVLVLLTTAFLAAEFARYRWSWFKNIFTRIFFPLLRESEKYSGLTGATLYLVSATATCILFERTIAVTAVMILSISDSLAALVGRTWGRHRFLAKSLQGSATFFLCTVVLLIIFRPGESVMEMLLVAGVVTLVEAAAIPVKDNITIPLAAALSLKLIS